MANREISFKADGGRDPVLLYRDAPETKRIFSAIIDLNTVSRKLHRAYNNFKVKPEDMKKLKEEFNEVLNSLRGYIRRSEAVCSSPVESAPTPEIKNLPLRR